MNLHTNRTILITGANGNLGTAVVQTFLEQGFRIVATVSKEATLKELPQHPMLHAAAIDLTDEAATAAFVQQTIVDYPQTDAALLLVGGFAMGDVANTSSVDIQKQISLNFDTAYHVTRPLLVHLQKRGNGRIVFIGARPALEPAAGKNLIAYGLSKSLLFTLANYINETCKGTNITASVVVPSTLDTALNRKSMPDADPDKWVKPEALAEILAFIVSGKGAPLREGIYKAYNNA